MSSIIEIQKQAQQKMSQSLEALKNNLSKIRTGRAHTSIMDHVQVDYYGTMVPINQVANISLIDSRTISVQVWEKPMAAKVEKAIRECDLGLNPSAQGELIRVPMPALTEERRRELTKVVRSEGENSKVAVRNLRRDANDAVKKLLKNKEVSEDDDRRSQDEIQKITDKFVSDIDKLIETKEQEVMAV